MFRIKKQFSTRLLAATSCAYLVKKLDILETFNDLLDVIILFQPRGIIRKCHATAYSRVER